MSLENDSKNKSSKTSGVGWDIDLLISRILLMRLKAVSEMKTTEVERREAIEAELERLFETGVVSSNINMREAVDHFFEKLYV